MKIAVRLDDIAPDMDWERFFRFKKLLDDYHIKPLIGVIPDNKDANLKWTHGDKNQIPEFWDYMKALGDEGWCIAMHGHQHIYSTQKGGMFPLNHFSEFAGKPYEEQLSMIREGKKILETNGIFTDIFMAPAHSYDANTLKALRTAGFCALTDGFGDVPYRYQGLTFYPISFKLSRTLKKKSGYSTMVVHTGTISDNEFDRYEKYFQNQEVEWINYSEYLDQPPVQQSMAGKWVEWMLATGKHILSSLR